MSGPDREADGSAHDPLDRRDRLYERARGLPEGERSAFLDEQCGDDAELRAELESLLSHAVEAEAFMDALGRLGDEPARASDMVDRLNAALEGRYRIEGEVGTGGMAMVYLADDLRHERKVAIKVLKPDLAAMVGGDRFLAEIKTTAHLQHPHILPLFDSGEADGFLYYVMPFVEGESLRERLDRERQLPVDDAVRIASNVAEALDHAHRRGVVHRDIKPANILLRDGQPLVSDFGIALAVGAAGGDRLTETGLSVGTPQYMSPEQTTGDQAVGPATDIYALGCVLYESLAGEPPYVGATPQAILGRIITRVPPPITEHRKTVPAHVEAALSRALEKVPADRFRTAGEFVAALSEPGFRHAASREPAQGAAPWKMASVVGMATIAVLLVAFVAWKAGRQEPDDLNWYNLNLSLAVDGMGSRYASRVAISPDGSRYVYVGEGSGTDTARFGLWIRRRSQARPVPLPGLSGTRNPAFSPDGRSVAVLQERPGGRRALLRAPLDGSGVVTLVEGELDYMGHSWGDDGYIYIGSNRGVLRVPEAGGQLERVTRVDTAGGETAHQGPVALPGGRGVVFTVRRSPTFNEALYQIGVAGLVTREHRVLVSGVRAEYSPPGVLLHVTSDGGLLATPFDARRLEITGQSTPIASDVSVGLLGSVDLAVSNTGTLVYGVAGSPGLSELVLVAKDGSVRAVDPAWTAGFTDVSVSPDGSRLAVEVSQGAAAQAIWVRSFESRTAVRLTPGWVNFRPTWTPDGARVAFISSHGGNLDAWTSRPDGSGDPDLVLDRERGVVETAWSTDGQWLVYRTDGLAEGHGDILAIDRERGSERPLFTTEFNEYSPALSPDGRWIAYMSNATGIAEIYVAPFPDVDRSRYKISEGGGTEPAWAHDGRELFFRDGNDDFVVVELVDSGDVPFTRPRRLFSGAAYRSNRPHRAYAVMPDDDAFVMIRAATAPMSSQLVVVEDFRELLEW